MRLFGYDISVRKARNDTSFSLSSFQDIDSLSNLFGIQLPRYSGQDINSATAMRLSAVYRCVYLIAGCLMQMPIDIYEKDATGKRVEVRPMLTKLLNVQPTMRYSAAQFWDWVAHGILLRGNAYVWIRRTPMGIPNQLIPLPYYQVEPCRDGEMLVYRLHYVTNKEHAYVTVHQDDMLHFTNAGFDGRRAPSVISQGAYRAAGLAMSMEDYASDFFETGALQRYALLYKKQFNLRQADEIRKMFESLYQKGTNGAHMPIVLDQDATIQNLSISLEDQQLLESREYGVTDILRAFGVPSFMANQEQKTTSWGTGVSEIGQSFLRYTMQPHVLRCENEMERKLVMHNPGQYIKFNTNALVRATMKDRYLSYKMSLGGGGVPGFMSINEVRNLEDMPMVEDDKYDMPYLPPDKSSETEEGGEGDDNNQPKRTAPPGR